LSTAANRGNVDLGCNQDPLGVRPSSLNGQTRGILAVHFLEKITRRNSIRRFTVVSAIPFFLLAVDFFFSPIWIDTHITKSDTGLNDLVQHNSVYLGSFRGNDVFVSLDDIRDPNT
jgi:hypothetical protein